MLLHSSVPSITPISLGLLAASVGLPFVASAEVTTDDLYAKLTSPTAALPGFNVEGGSVFTNYVAALNQEQLFFIRKSTGLVERPESDPIPVTTLKWCSDLTFSDVNNSSLMGYAGRCVSRMVRGYDAIEAVTDPEFAYSKEGFMRTHGISAVFVEQLNIFECQIHADTAAWSGRFWDDGSETSPLIMWEGHDEGDMSPNAASSSWSASGEMIWTSVDEVAQLFNTSVDEFTPETFKQVYMNTWIKTHEYEAANANPNPGPEMEIVEQVKDEMSPADETATTTPDQPDSTAMEDPVVQDDSGSGRQLASVAARFVSAALRVFGI